jgi:hypothetical protein
MARRGGLLAVGVGLVAAAAVLGFHVIPSDAGPDPGASTEVTEHAETWTPAEGWRTGTRTVTTSLVEGDEGLAVRERVQGPASPRGASFTLPVLDDDLRLAADPGGRAGFPAVPFAQSVPDTVHVAVPWADDDGEATVGAYDRFERMGTVERDGLTLVEYHARHATQQFLHEGTIWTRQSERTAIVDVVTGTVVDYEHHETLWAEPQEDDDPLLGGLQQELAEREKVWEAHLEPTDEAVGTLLERAEASRRDTVEDVLMAAGPALVAGQAMLGAALTGRPRRVLGTS